MKLSWQYRLATAILLTAAAAVAGAQRVDVPIHNAQRAADAAARVQDRSAQAQDRAVQAQDRAVQAQERATQAQERGSAAAERSSRATGATERAGGRASAGLARAALARAQAFASDHMQRLKDLVVAYPQVLELVEGLPVVRSEIVAIDPDEQALKAARRHGYAVAADETVEGLGVRYVTLVVPPGTQLQRALADLQRAAPATEFTTNHIHVQSGTSGRAANPGTKLAPSTRIEGRAIGIIDGGVAASPVLPRLFQRGFVAGAPVPDAHATAVASLAAGTGRVRSAAPATPLLIADVYGSDPRGGNSLAIAKALGWMAQQRVPVVVVSLVGPRNPIVARAVRAVQARGIHIVAPVGNAGAAAPPMYPASYPGVIAVTGVDSRNRLLIEAGRGSHVDYAAPGADIRAAAFGGRLVRVRGTSYAAPLVAGRLWTALKHDQPLAYLDRHAVDLGPKGPDTLYGRGLLCSNCR